MLVYKCDLCGTYYEDRTPIYTNKQSGKRLIHLKTNDENFVYMCPSCAKDLESRINAKMEAR